MVELDLNLIGYIVLCCIKYLGLKLIVLLIVVYNINWLVSRIVWFVLCGEEKIESMGVMWGL